MVFLFSDGKSSCAKEMIQILTGYGANYISDKAVFADNGAITLISQTKKTDLHIKSGIAVLIDGIDRFEGQRFPDSMIGVCADTNQKALQIFSQSNIPVISCGMNAINTITLSSLNSDTLLASLQRTVTDCRGNCLDPEEFKIKLTRDYSPFAVMASTAVLLLCGITPDRF